MPLMIDASGYPVYAGTPIYQTASATAVSVFSTKTLDATATAIAAAVTNHVETQAHIINEHKAIQEALDSEFCCVRADPRRNAPKPHADWPWPCRSRSHPCPSTISRPTNGLDSPHKTLFWTRESTLFRNASATQGPFAHRRRRLALRLAPQRRQNRRDPRSDLHSAASYHAPAATSPLLFRPTFRSIRLATAMAVMSSKSVRSVHHRRVPGRCGFRLDLALGRYSDD